MSHIMKLLKKLLKLIFNRIFYIVFALLVQLGWLFMMAWKLAAYSKYISIGITAISIIAVLWILNKKINPSYKLGWTMLILVFPVFGLLLYILFGKSRIAIGGSPTASSRKSRKRRTLDAHTREGRRSSTPSDTAKRLRVSRDSDPDAARRQDVAL